jgi:hypothetical protein
MNSSFLKRRRESKKFSVYQCCGSQTCRPTIPTHRRSTEVNNTHPVVKREVAAYGELREKNFFDFLHILSISNEHYLSLVLGIYQKF